MQSYRRKKSVDRTRELLEDPVEFTRAFLDHDIWSKQEEILRSVAASRRTAVKACHASGKTFIAAAAVLWWLVRHPDAIVITTAPTWTQVERVLWSEIHSMLQRSGIEFPIPAATSLRLGPNRYAIGLSTNEGVRFQGYHGNVLIILDEAPGILSQIYEAIEGIRAGGDVRILALGNPSISSGPFYDAFSGNREGWNQITISAFNTPNLEAVTPDQPLKMSEEELDANPRPYLTTRRWVKEKYLEWGPFHPLWESRVLGNFASV
jgi:phage terminase large subunit